MKFQWDTLVLFNLSKSNINNCYSLFVMSPRGVGTDLFSPLALYFRGDDFPIEKKGEKTMIGQHGWLESTEQTLYDKNKQSPQKKTRILDGIRKIAKDMVSG